MVTSAVINGRPTNQGVPNTASGLRAAASHKKAPNGEPCGASLDNLVVLSIAWANYSQQAQSAAEHRFDLLRGYQIDFNPPGPHLAGPDDVQVS